MHQTTKRRLLLVEDESLVAMLVEDMLLDLGCEVVEVASRLDTGLALASHLDIDAAVLDVNLGGNARSFPIAERLAERGIPFVFATGYGRAGLEGRFATVPVVQKPFRADDLEAVLNDLTSPRSGALNDDGLPLPSN